MSEFYGELRGDRGRVSRRGSKKSGMWAHVRGWNMGVEVSCGMGENGKHICKVYETGGSNGRKDNKLITTITE